MENEKENQKETKQEQETKNQNQSQSQNKNQKIVDIVLTGEVVSTKADKTASVNVERIFQHSVYKKIVRRKKKYLVHDEHNKCKPGDIVKIKLVRPISKRKRWLLVDILSSSVSSASSASNAPAEENESEVAQ